MARTSYIIGIVAMWCFRLYNTTFNRYDPVTEVSSFTWGRRNRKIIVSSILIVTLKKRKKIFDDDKRDREFLTIEVYKFISMYHLVGCSQRVCCIEADFDKTPLDQYTLKPLNYFNKS